MDSGDRLRGESTPPRSPSMSSRMRSPPGGTAGSGRGGIWYRSSTGDASLGLSGLMLDRLCRRHGGHAPPNRSSALPPSLSTVGDASISPAGRRRWRRPSLIRGCSSSSDVCTALSLHSPVAAAAAVAGVSSDSGQISSIVGDRWIDIGRGPRSEEGRAAPVTSAVVRTCCCCWAVSLAWQNAPSTLRPARAVALELVDDLPTATPRPRDLEVLRNPSMPHALRFHCVLYQQSQLFNAFIDYRKRDFPRLMITNHRWHAIEQTTVFNGAHCRLLQSTATQQLRPKK